MSPSILGVRRFQTVARADGVDLRERSKTLENFWIGIGQLSSGFHSDHLIVVTGIVRPIGEIAITHTYFY